MPVIVDLYTERSSWLHRMDPRVKLLFVAGSLVILLVFKNLFFMVAAIFSLHLLHLSAKMPARKFGFIWKTLLPVSLLMLTLWVIFYPAGEPLFEIWIVRITPTSIAQGLVLALRILCMAFVVFAWLYTTDQQSLVRSLVKLRLPYEWGLTLALALRYIPTFQGMFGIISDAQQARALNISSGKGFQRVRSMMPIFVAMIISSLRASDQLAKAMESRGLGARGVSRTSYFEIRMRPIDMFYTLALLLLFAGLLFLNLALGFGRQPLAWF